MMAVHSLPFFTRLLMGKTELPPVRLTSPGERAAREAERQHVRNLLSMVEQEEALLRRDPSPDHDEDR